MTASPGCAYLTIDVYRGLDFRPRITSSTSESFGHKPIETRQQKLEERRKSGSSYHRLDIWMRHRVEFVKVELIVWPNVDIRAFILGAVTIFRG